MSYSVCKSDKPNPTIAGQSTDTDTLSVRVFVTDGNYRTEKKTKGYKIAANYLYKTIFLKVVDSGFFQQFS